MPSALTMMKETIRNAFLRAGASAVGFARAKAVDHDAWTRFCDWLREGCHAGMAYMSNHAELRRDPRKLLDDAATVVTLAFNYTPEKFRDSSAGMIAAYAYGLDYHDVVRRRAAGAIESLKNVFGGEWRTCVDSAPVMERYWAVKSGLGFIGRNGALIVPCAGSMVFLAEVLTTLEVEPDQPLKDTCAGCGACIAQCPGGALREDATIDSRKCISYLTIEHRGPWTAPEAVATMRTPSGLSAIYGCDICLRVCPHNHGTKPTAIPEFKPLRDILTLTAEDIREMTPETFSATFRGSAIKRARLAGLHRNIR